MSPVEKIHSSFRDPSGFLFRREGVLYRQINELYRPDYDLLMSSGLYQRLVEKGRLVPHQERDVAPAVAETAYKVIEPQVVPFISYPYEWSFSMLKEAALTTLYIQKQALKDGMSLKDASAYNIQFVNGKAALIDTLSFERYRENEPWVAYRQFCQHFLAPLALAAYVDVRLSQLLRLYIDGVPLDLASRLLPLSTRLNLGLYANIHLHARAQQRYAGKDISEAAGSRKMNKKTMLGLIGSLEDTVRRLKWKPAGTEWGNYYQDTNYSEAAFEAKKKLVADWARQAAPRMVWDLGGNTGVFSRAAAAGDALVISWDIDPAAVEQNYLEMKKARETNIVPLVLDLTNPSPSIGWHNRERTSFSERAPADLVLALALIHHLAISNNVPLEELALFFHSLGRWLIIEFVPKEDSQVQRLLATRADIFPDYHVQSFEQVFARRFKLHRCEQIQDSQRRLYLMERI